jgi:hypothetical protein
MGAMVDLPQQQGSGCAALKIAMVVAAATYAGAVAVLRPSNTSIDAVATGVNAVIGVTVAVFVLFLSPSVGVQLAFAQGVVAVLAVVLPLLTALLSGRALRGVHALFTQKCPRHTPGSPPRGEHSSDSFDTVDGDLSDPFLGAASEDGEGTSLMGTHRVEASDLSDFESTRSEDPRDDGKRTDVDECIVVKSGESPIAAPPSTIGRRSSIYRSELERLYDEML